MTKKRPTNMASASEVVERRIGAQTGERAAIGRRGRSVGIENFRVSVRSRVPEPRQARLDHTRNGAETECCRRHANQCQNRHLDFRRTDLLADVFGRTTDHEAGKKDSDDAEQQHAEEARAGSPDDHLVDHHVGQKDATAQRQEAIVHGVDRPVR